MAAGNVERTRGIVEETAGVLRRLFDQGKIRAICHEQLLADQMTAFRSAAPLHVVQPPYNLFERQTEADVLPYAKRHDLTVLAYGPLCRGLLTGRMRRDTKFTGDDVRGSDPTKAV